MKTRIIKTRIWSDDEKFGSLSSVEKLIFIYFITNERIGMTGYYECPERVVLFESGVTKSQLDSTKIKLAELGMVLFHENWVFVVHAEKHNNFSGEKNEVAYKKEKSAIPSEIIDAFTYPIDRVSIPSDTLSNHKLIISNKNTNQYSESFLKFWEAYPKKESKKKSWDIWDRKNYDQHIFEILDFLKRAKGTDRWKNIKYIKQPTTFLNGECWNDELEAYQEPVEGKKKKPTYQGHPAYQRGGKIFVIVDGEHKEFVGSERDLEWV